MVWYGLWLPLIEWWNILCHVSDKTKRVSNLFIQCTTLLVPCRDVSLWEHSALGGVAVLGDATWRYQLWSCLVHGIPEFCEYVDESLSLLHKNLKQLACVGVCLTNSKSKTVVFRNATFLKHQKLMWNSKNWRRKQFTDYNHCVRITKDEHYISSNFTTIFFYWCETFHTSTLCSSGYLLILSVITTK